MVQGRRNGRVRLRRGTAAPHGIKEARIFQSEPPRAGQLLLRALHHRLLGGQQLLEADTDSVIRPVSCESADT